MKTRVPIFLILALVGCRDKTAHEAQLRWNQPIYAIHLELVTQFSTIYDYPNPSILDYAIEPPARIVQHISGIASSKAIFRDPKLRAWLRSDSTILDSLDCSEASTDDEIAIAIQRNKLIARDPYRKYVFTMRFKGLDEFYSGRLTELHLVAFGREAQAQNQKISEHMKKETEANKPVETTRPNGRASHL